MDVFVARLDKNVLLPSYARPLDAGLDLRAAEQTLIPAGQRRLIKTGIALAIPEGFVGLIWDRSGLAANAGITCLGGVVDAGYRGEIKVVLANLGDAPFEVKVNDRIAQILFQPVTQAHLRETEKLDETHRGSGGFGSTGKN